MIYTHHFLDFELDVLQTPLEVCQFDGAGLAVGGLDVERSDGPHRRRGVDEKHGYGVLGGHEQGRGRGNGTYPRAFCRHCGGTSQGGRDLSRVEECMVSHGVTMWVLFCPPCPLRC